MLERIKALNDNVVNLVIYVPSENLQYIVKNMIKQRLKVHSECIRTPETLKDIREAKLDALSKPLLSDSWLINIDAEKLSKKDFIDQLSKPSPFALTVFWISNYKTYLGIKNLELLKKQGAQTGVYTLSRLDSRDIRYLYKHILEGKDCLTPELLNYVSSNYSYDVQAVCTLFNSLKSGEEVNTKRDIIELVGIGGASVDGLLIKMLRSGVNTERGKKRFISEVIREMDDLTVKYKHSTIVNYMLSTIDTFITIKELQILGYNRRFGLKIPENYDESKIKRALRYERLILDEISIPMLLNLKACLTSKIMDSEIVLLKAIYEFANLKLQSVS